MTANKPLSRRSIVTVRDTPYTIDEQAPEPEPFPLDLPGTRAILLLKWLLWGLYLQQKLRLLLALGGTAPAPLSCAAAWALFLAEVVALLPPALFQLNLALYLVFGDPNWRRPKARLVGDHVPLIDVLITCCGEDVNLLMDTVTAAASQDYPPHRYRVIVLDDARSAKLEHAIAAFNKTTTTNNNNAVQRAHVIYLSRTKHPNAPHYFKAGNLRFGMTETAKSPSPSEFVAGLDADAIAEPDWLRRTIPHLLLDPRLALVNSAQAPYNIPDPDVLGQGAASSNDWIDALHDNMGALTCFGSGYVLRRSALDAIGGWPRVTVGEDILCGFWLAGRGWRIASCGEVLQRDMTPGSMDALVKQRMRWMDGDLHLVKTFRFFLPGLDPCSKRTTVQRLSAFINSVRLFRAVTDSAFPLAMASLLCVVNQPGRAGDVHSVHQDRWTLKFIYLAAILTDKLASILMYGGVGGLTNSELWLSPFKAISVARFCFSDSIPTFQPTSTVISETNERSAHLRRPLLDRLRSPSAVVSLLYTSSAAISLMFFYSTQYPRKCPTVFHTTGVLVWLLECIVKMSIPLRYMTWPPTVPERNGLLEKDKAGVSRPKAKQPPVVEGRIDIPWLDVLQVVLVLCVDWSQI